MAKIMLVEDDNNLREIYEARLLAEGYEIISAADGEAALAMAVKEKPDLIISDVMMPKISGFDMLDLLRTTPETKDVKVIMMTALSQAEDQGRAEKLGADRYLVKSQVTLEDVAKVAREVLGEAAPAPAENPAPAADQAAVDAAPSDVPATVTPTAIPVTMPADDTPPAADPATATAPVAEPAVTDTPAVQPASAPAALANDPPADTPVEPTAPLAPAPEVPAPEAAPAPQPEPVSDQPAPDPVNAASTDAAELVAATNDLMGTANTETPAAPESTGQHGKVVTPINDLSAPAVEAQAPEAAPAAAAPDNTPNAPQPQPGNVIQPGMDPNQIAL